jgi:hypothetical protein
VAAIPHDKFANAILDRGLRPEACVAHQSRDVSERFRDITGLHWQHILYHRAFQLAPRKRHDIQKSFRMLSAETIDERRRVRVDVDGECVIDEMQRAR